MADVFELQSCCNEFQFTDPEDDFESWNGLRGPAGPAGPPGPAGSPGTSVELRGPVASTGQLPATAPSGELWLVGTSSPFVGWFYNGTSWQNVGQIAVGPVGPAGPAGDPGSDGTTFMPSVSSEGMLSWTNDGGKPNPDPVNIRGPKGEPGVASLTILSYGNSTWADFIAAYNANSIVYCRASITAADPGAGSQVRMAAMAYVNHPTVPTSVDFVYYYPATHSNSQQGDQLFVYTLSQTNGWSYVVKNTFSRVVAGENMTSSYANGTLTLNATGGGTADALPLAGGTMAGDIDMDGNKVTKLPTPTNYQDAANKDYVDRRYLKPSSGIPKSDLASDVQAALVPSGGSAGQIPVKASATDYDLKWATAALHISVASFSSFPQTISNSAITAGMRVVNCVWGTPSAITGDVSWTTADGSLTLSGSISGSTTAEIDLILF